MPGEGSAQLLCRQITEAGWEGGQEGSQSGRGLCPAHSGSALLSTLLIICHPNRTTNSPQPLPLVKECALQEQRQRVTRSSTAWKGPLGWRGCVHGALSAKASPLWKGLLPLVVFPYLEQELLLLLLLSRFSPVRLCATP